MCNNIVIVFLAGGNLSAGGVSGIITFLLLMPLVIIDIVVIMSYVVKHRPLSKVANIVESVSYCR